MSGNVLILFLILGNGGSGTSLLRGLMNAHSGIECGFEVYDKEVEHHPKNSGDNPYRWCDWKKSATESELLWGNKMPLERLWRFGKTDTDIEKLIDDYLIIWIVRRIDRWNRPVEGWNRGRSVYWGMRNRKPDRIIEVSFEDLLLRTRSELTRICDFLGVLFEHGMLDGVSDTGHRKYNYGKILPEKV